MAPGNDLPAPAGPQKHRACDECRFRKIACSKEPDGCLRCQKEGIPCVYSPQKPMGRPRKRRLIVENPAPSAAPASVPNHHQQPMLSTDPTGLFSPSLTSETSYLDLLPDYDSGNSNLFDIDDNAAFTYFSLDSQGLFDGVGMPAMNIGQADPLEGISFDETDPSIATMSKDLNDSLQRYMVSQYLQASTPSEPSPSANSSNCFESLGSTTTDTTSPVLGAARAHPTSSCDCLSSLSLALGSLNRLPSDVLSAMRVAREATKIAHDSLNCAQCYQDMYDLTKPPPISRFQSMMCLGALVPSACNAYAAILEMVDRDTERAKQEFQMLYFSYKEVGGIWTRVADEDSASDNPDCALLKSYNNRYLEPDTWRTTMRAILKVEVYGFKCGSTSAASSVDGDNPCSCVNVHRGLRDVVTLLDQENQKRHDIADALIQTGQHHLIWHSPYFLMSGPPKPFPREDRQCMRMLDMARMALSNLVIT
ncbi:hypothetical protein TrVFT333_007287 [Trichoderma virens FT-333]|nr:hypothetical protein TrVFT333_007287 [Trichoderma virens FT-333]